MVEVTDEDRKAAASGYYAWCSGNPVIPNRILGGYADDRSMVQAFARHRIAAEQRGKIEGARLALEAAAVACDAESWPDIAVTASERDGDTRPYEYNIAVSDMVCAIAALSPAKIVGEG